VQEVGVVVVDLEEDDLPVDRDGAEIVLAVRVIVGCEGVEGGNGLVDLEDSIGAKCLDAAGDDDPSGAVVLAQRVIERTTRSRSEVMRFSRRKIPDKAPPGSVLQRTARCRSELSGKWRGGGVRPR
jgi:hypothetical protein